MSVNIAPMSRRVRSTYAVVAASILVIALTAADVLSGQSGGPPLEIGPADAPLTILVFADFECPFCARLAPTLKRLAENNPRDIRIVFKHFPLAIHPQAPAAHAAAMVAASRGRFWEMHDLLYANNPRLSRQDLFEYSRRLGLDTKAVATAIDTNAFKAAIESDLRDGKNLGVEATPTLFLNGLKIVGVRSYENLEAVVNEQLGRAPTRLAAAAGPPKFDLTASPVRGGPGAPITIVELSDLQCPFCARATTVVEEVLARYPGKVRWVFKNFPLEMHPDARLAHQAALAAGEQGRFWEMHDAVFRQQQAMKRSDLLALAGNLGLDMNRFTADLESQRLKAIIERDIREGQQAGVTGTPMFYINGVPVSGAQPAATFVKVIDAELARLEAAAAK